MSASLHELQRRFAASLLGSTAERGMAVYRNTVTLNYRHALAATYPVVRELTGRAFFDTAVDAYANAYPSGGGDLNVYGGEFADFLAAYPHAKALPYLPCVARLEWAIDEASRAADQAASPAGVLAALAGTPAHALAQQRLALDASCRLVHSPFPVMRIWQAHQTGFDGRVDLDAGADRLLVRRERSAPSVARIAPADFAFLHALRDGGDLAAAFDAAVAVDGDFDLAVALRTFIADGTIGGLA
jgi:hypothetical protein